MKYLVKESLVKTDLYNLIFLFKKSLFRDNRMLFLTSSISLEKQKIENIEQRINAIKILSPTYGRGLHSKILELQHKVGVINSRQNAVNFIIPFLIEKYQTHNEELSILQEQLTEDFQYFASCDPELMATLSESYNLIDLKKSNDFEEEQFTIEFEPKEYNQLMKIVTISKNLLLKLTNVSLDFKELKSMDSDISKEFIDWFKNYLDEGDSIELQKLEKEFKELSDLKLEKEKELKKCKLKYDN